jgi:hypothetical protein
MAVPTLACYATFRWEPLRSRNFKDKVKLTLRLTVGEPVRPGVEPTLGLLTRYYLLAESGCLVSDERPL